MLNEQRATALHYDAATDVARVYVTEAPGTVRTRTVASTLLLDASGFLVGVDVDNAGPDRVVVMLGPHEAVAKQESARVAVLTDASATVYEVRIRSARDAIRARDKNPYV